MTIVESILELQHCNAATTATICTQRNMLLVRNIIVVKVLVRRNTFDIGGHSKDFSQIAGVKDSYVFADDWDMPDGAKLPLWMLGFLY